MLHRGRAFEARDLAALAAGSDPMAAIGQKIAAYANQRPERSSDPCLAGVFGSNNSTSSSAASFDLTIDGGSADTPTALAPRHDCGSQGQAGRSGRETDRHRRVHSKVLLRPH